MKNKCFFLFQALIICNGYIFVNALIGFNIQNATLPEYPSVVALVEINSNRTTEENIFCTGVFISKCHILTYEQCIYNIGSRHFKVFAEHPNILEAREYFLMWWTTYDMWASKMRIPLVFEDNDVALMRIIGHTSNYMMPSLLTTIRPQMVLVGHEVQILGFGRTNTSPGAQTLQIASVNVLSNEECEKHLFLQTGVVTKIHERYLCTSNALLCPTVLLTEGDSGGPLYYRRTLVALNAETLPGELSVNDPRRVNLHLGLEWYRHFINNNIRY